jgi:lipopolysaccharide export system permease protein
MPYALPIALLYAIPGTSLFAACSVYGRISAANEIVAIKSLGISPMTVLWPVLTLAFALSIGVVWLNDVAVSWGRAGTQRVILQSLEQILYGMLRTRRSYSGARFSVNVIGVQGERLLRPTLTVNLSDIRGQMIFTAEEAVLQCDPSENQLRICLTNGTVDFGDKRRMAFPDTQAFNIPLWAASRDGADGDRPSNIPLRRIPQEVERQLLNIERQEQALASEAAFQLITGDFGALTGHEWQVRHGGLLDQRSWLSRLHTEPWRRWANGFSCLAFVIVGAPLAIRLRNSDVWTSFALCFAPVLILYYPLLVYGVRLAKSGELPPYCVWLGNLAFAGAGLLLIRSVLRR